VFEEYVAFIESFGKLQALPTHTYFAGMNIGETIHVDLDKGNTVHVTYLAKGHVDSAGFTELFFEVNGQPRSLYVRDKNAAKSMGLKVQFCH
jgi:pyruvate carboxylase